MYNYPLNGYDNRNEHYFLNYDNAFSEGNSDVSTIHTASITDTASENPDLYLYKVQSYAINPR